MPTCRSCSAIAGAEWERDFPSCIFRLDRVAGSDILPSDHPQMSDSRVRHSLVLCIDDAEIALRVRKLLLTSAGYRVLTATSGEEGLGLFKDNPVELVIADHFLSDKSGSEIAAEMKDLKPGVPILIVSAAAEAPPGLEFSDGFLSKGEGPDALLDAMAALLQRRRPSR